MPEEFRYEFVAFELVDNFEMFDGASPLGGAAPDQLQLVLLLSLRSLAVVVVVSRRGRR